MEADFGKYRLLKRLGAGGMGEVFLAEPADAPPGAQKVVLKRILPHLTVNARFLRLFLDEARVAARLTHPNIVRILELGETDGTWFVGMEHIPGRDLRDLTRRSLEVQRPVPLGVACRIAANVAAGLHYAHQSTDPKGKPLKLIHRDVSPHNVLVGFDGAVKIIDFGVAKAANRATHTKTGVLKGKFPYMAPEQAEGKRIDRRIDVFALGIVLWEVLTGRHLFRARSDAATLRKVRACEVSPPSRFGAVPLALDEIVMRALAKVPGERYQDAGALGQALEELMLSEGWPSTAQAVSSFVRELFPLLEAEPPQGNTSSEEPETATLAPQRRPASKSSFASLEPKTELVELGPGRAVNAQDSLSEEAARLLVEVTQRSTNLAPQQTSFIGRVAELAELHQMLRQKARLLTLLGPGGTGKTRLSMQLASQQLASFPTGGVWFCDLTEARDLDGICVGVARALDVPLPPGKSSEESAALLSQAIAGRGELLIVLDNLEQVIEQASFAVERWMAAAPKAQFVATSRELLRVPYEIVFEVPPLKVPERGEDVASSEAVMLFLERARAARPSYQLTAADEAAVAEIVRQLDGMPLAIELAAARMAVLSPAQLVQRLPRRFELLAGKARDATARQATLKGAIDWSWTLLSPWEQAALAQCSLFRGGFTAEAAEAVLDLSRWKEDSPPEALTCIMALRSKSLVRSYVTPGTENELRYGLYESIREFARERLDPSRDEAGATERHARYYIGLGEAHRRHAESSAQALDALALERENLYAVFQWGIAAAEGAIARRLQALRAVLVLDPLLSLRGPFGAHLLMLDAALEKAPDADPLLRARGHEARGKARQSKWRLEEASADYQEMLALALEHQAPELEGRARFCLGSVLRLSGRAEEARAEYERALAVQRQVGDRRLEGRTLANIGIMLEEEGRAGEALQHYASALEIHREVGDRRFEGVILSNLGVLQQHLGLLGQAKLNYENALAIHRELGNRRSEGIALANLGDLHRDLERSALAASFYQRALAIDREVGNRRYEGLVLAGLGSLELEGCRIQPALEYLRQALAVLREVKDRSFEALVLASIGAATAGSGALAEAEEIFAQADRALSQAGESGLGEALEVYRAHLELAQSRQAAKEERLLDSERLESSVAARVRRAESATAADPEHPGGGSSPAERSEDVRSALRSLRAAMRGPAPS